MEKGRKRGVFKVLDGEGEREGGQREWKREGDKPGYIHSLHSESEGYIHRGAALVGSHRGGGRLLTIALREKDVEKE